MAISKILSERIPELRKNMSADQIANYLKIGRTTVFRYLNPRTRIVKRQNQWATTEFKKRKPLNGDFFNEHERKNWLI